MVLLLLQSASAQSTKRIELSFDLSKIGFIVNGQQVCEDKYRLQDFPSKMMDRIIAGGKDSVPVLIGMISDDREIGTREPIICYWSGMTVSDAALCLLGDLFADASEKETIPGSSLARMMDPQDQDRPAADQLHLFVQRHGRAVLEAKWRKLWSRYANQVEWDEQQRCFRLKGK